ncbi:MAG: ribulose 1,5-bisphosphate carboxylase [Betaproteobacteria bacterium]|nr:ribulose 1,5-bisphosphate carboxylase [Betaproteobacteria bacterium]PWB59740.1 MAG: ribulose 1,5-bisphosphate carboxylase [Betaproteobacteria bacterium]
MAGRILATYRIAASAGDIEARARALASEQSVEMPVEAIRDARVLAEVIATVESIRPSGDAFEVALGIAAETTGGEASQLVNMLFGNCSLQPEVELVDVAFPPGYAKAFPGPEFGIAGLRAMLGAPQRPLTCSALKPQGSTVDHLAHLARTFALAGIDVVKDDHGLANQAFSPFAERVPAVQQAIAEANRETGGRTLYAPTLSGDPRALADQLRVARDCGLRMALVAPMLVGLPVFVELRRESGLALLAHPAFGGATRIAPALLLGKLFRLFGADATIFPNHGGRFSYGRDTCLAIARAARDPWEDLAPVLPVPAGGMSVERVPEMVADYGRDTMLLIGGGLLVAGDRLAERSREFAEKVRRS